MPGWPWDAQVVSEVFVRTGLDVVFIKLLSWLTYGEAFVGCPPAYQRDARCPVMEWEEQDGFGCARALLLA